MPIYFDVYRLKQPVRSGKVPLRQMIPEVLKIRIIKARISWVFLGGRGVLVGGVLLLVIGFTSNYCNICYEFLFNINYM